MSARALVAALSALALGACVHGLQAVGEDEGAAGKTGAGGSNAGSPGTGGQSGAAGETGGGAGTGGVTGGQGGTSAGSGGNGSGGKGGTGAGAGGSASGSSGNAGAAGNAAAGAAGNGSGGAGAAGGAGAGAGSGAGNGGAGAGAGGGGGGAAGAGAGGAGAGGGAAGGGGAVACAIALTYDFETGAQGFTHAPTSKIASDDPWAVGKPTSLPCHGGTKCWATNLGSAGYSDCQTAELVSPTVDLSGCAGAGKTVTLAFWHEYKFEVKSMGKWWDGGLLQVSSNDGKTWDDVMPTPGYEGTIDGDFSPCTPVPDVAGHPGWSGTIPGGGWVQVKLDLAPAYLVPTFRARWLVGADGNTTERGWGIDDVTITSQ